MYLVISAVCQVWLWQPFPVPGAMALLFPDELKLLPHILSVFVSDFALTMLSGASVEQRWTCELNWKSDCPFIWLVFRWKLGLHGCWQMWGFKCSSGDPQSQCSVLFPLWLFLTSRLEQMCRLHWRACQVLGWALFVFLSGYAQADGSSVFRTCSILNFHGL